MKRIKDKLIANQSFRPCVVLKTKDIFKRLGFKSTSQSTGGQVADFTRSGLESFSRTERNFNQWQYEEYAKMKALEDSSPQDKASDDKTPDDVQVNDDKAPAV